MADNKTMPYDTYPADYDPDEDYGVPAHVAATGEAKTHTAEFPKALHAKDFFARVTENGGSGWYMKDVKISGRKVTWTDDLPADYDAGYEFHFLCMLETVGYYGSSETRKAKLDGVPAPVQY